MRTFLKFSVPSLAAVLTLAACGSSSSSETTSATTQTTSSTPAATVALIRSAANPTIGASVLTNAQGMTLYRLSGEQNGKFICTSSACLKDWHPVLVTGASTPTGTVSSLGTVKRPEDTVQVTYKGEPLYTFTADQKAGEANGQGIKDVGTWNAVTVAAGAAGGSSAPAEAASGGSREESKKGGYAY